MVEQQAQLDEATVALIEEHVRHLLQAMGLSQVTVECAVEESQSVLNIKLDVGDDGRLLIGTHGSHLAALQHIIRCVIRRQLAGHVRVMVDINGYRARREHRLLELAEETARKAHRTGRTVVLEPMSAADRRAIHTALTGHKDILTESLGEEPNRRVVVRPVFL